MTRYFLHTPDGVTVEYRTSRESSDELHWTIIYHHGGQ